MDYIKDLYKNVDLLVEMSKEDLCEEDQLQLQDRLKTLATMISFNTEMLEEEFKPVDTNTEYGTRRVLPKGINIFGEEELL